MESVKYRYTDLLKITFNSVIIELFKDFKWALEHGKGYINVKIGEISIQN